MSKNENQIVRQPYPMTMARNNFTVAEMRIMLRITQTLQEHMEYGKVRGDINPDLFGNMSLILPTKCFLPDGDKNYTVVKNALSSITKKSLIIQGKDEKGAYKIDTRLILEYKYHHSNERVEVLISKNLLPFYLALAKNYSRYSLSIAFNFSSPYMIKMYQYLSHFKDKKTIEVRVDELREWLQLENKYQHTHALKKDLLIPIAKELKEKADVWFEIGQPFKESRRIVGWSFQIISNNKEEAQDPELQTERIIKHLRSYFKMSESQIFELQPVIGRPELYKRLCDKIADVYKQLQAQKGNIKSPAMYFIASAKEEFKEFYGVNSASKVEAQVKRNRQRGFKK